MPKKETMLIVIANIPFSPIISPFVTSKIELPFSVTLVQFSLRLVFL